jgi:hypothetical protein
LRGGVPTRAARDRRTELRSSSSLHTNSVKTTQNNAPVSRAAGPEPMAATGLDAAPAKAVIDMVNNPTDIDILARLVIFISFAKNWL